MAVTQIRNAQIQDQTLERQKLVLDFLAGADLNLTNGNNDATITGLSDGVNPNDAVNFSQLQAALAALTGSVQLRGGLDGASDLTANLTGNAYADGGTQFLAGDFFDITSDGDIVVSDGVVSVNAGDAIKILNDATDATITVADIFKIDNTEAADILRSANVVDNLMSMSATNVLSANQGMILDGRIVALEQCETEEFSVTADGETFTLANAPLAGLKNRQVYLNGLRLASGEYTIVGSVLTITTPPTEIGDCVQIDYRF